MSELQRTSNRRDFVIAAGACALTLTSAAVGPRAEEKAPLLDALPEAKAAGATESWETAINVLTGDAKVVDGRIILELPEIAENGNVVPMTVMVPSAMTANDFVRSLRIYSTGNLRPLIATFRFTPDSGKAVVSARIRLAKTQDIVALAELGDGTFLRRTKNVKVTIGGCGG